jgi:hypothetical protein
MSGQLYESHAERARRGQWEIDDLPWDEPIRFCGSSKREQLLCKLDNVDLTNVMYHLQLGARMRMGDHMLRTWRNEPALLDCLEWHDIDEQRHVRVLRRLLTKLSGKGDAVARNDRPTSPASLWSATYSSREKLGADRMLLHLLIDEAVSRTLFNNVAARSRIPLVRAVFAACAQDDVRHVEYLTVLAKDRFDKLSLLESAALHAAAVLHLAKLQSAFRPYVGSFAHGVNGSADSVVSAVFGATSRVLSDLGPGWQRSPLMRIVHAADRSAWMLWLLR